jgi:CubicO group peptidase (beta-lactamase class C family)
MTAEVHGTVAPGFEAARQVFAANFAREGDYREVGASFAVFHGGRPVVDLWGGFADRAGKRVWTRDTLINVWSSTKGVVALAAAMLVERGLIRYEDRVSSVWPEFAQGGKQDVTFAHILSHQAGLPGFAEPTTGEDQYDWQSCCAKLARQKPVWAPGTASSYHAMTFGWLAGEVVRRVAGKSVGRFVAEEIAKPLDADIFIGLPQAQESRAAEMIGPRSPAVFPPLSDVAMMALTNPQQNPESPNARAWRAAEIPAANGQASAAGLARIYALLAGSGELDGVKLVSPATIAKMTAPATADGRADMFLGFVDAWAMGVILNTPGVYGANPRAFGHSGWGGSFGCADPDAQIAIGYVCNQMGPELVGDPRTLSLCATIFGCAARM